MKDFILLLEAKKASLRAETEAKCKAIDEVVLLFSEQGGNSNKSISLPTSMPQISIAKNGNGSHPKRGRKMKSETAEMIPLVAALDEPFTSSDIRRVTNLEVKGSCNLVGRWIERNWLKRLAFGSYKRTSEYPRVGSVDPSPNNESTTVALHRQIRAEVDAEIAKTDPDRIYQ